MGRRVYGCEMESDGVEIKEENDRDYSENMKLPVDEFRKVIKPEFTPLNFFSLTWENFMSQITTLIETRPHMLDFEGGFSWTRDDFSKKNRRVTRARR